MEIEYKTNLESNVYKSDENSIKYESDKSNLRKLLTSEEPLILEDYEGISWMRESCDKRPC